MILPGASFKPEDVELMRVVLDRATALLPIHRRTSATRAALAERILKRAATGERDPARLEAEALLHLTDKFNDSHDISPERRMA